MRLRKFFITFNAIILLLPTFSSSAQAAPAKKITVAQAKVIHDKAVKATNSWIDKNPVVISTFASRSTEVFDKEIVTRDIAKQVSVVGNGQDSIIYSGSKIYASGNEFALRSFENEIASKLGLNVSAKFKRFDVKSLGIGESNLAGAAFDLAKPNVGDFYFITMHKSSCTTTTYSKEQLLSCRYLVENLLSNSSDLIEETFTISSGRLSKSVTTYSDGTKVVKSYNLFKGKISLPKGPYLDYDKVLNDPGFAKGEAIHNAQVELANIVAHAFAKSAFDNRELPSFDDWKSIAREWNLTMYDKGVGYKILLDSSGLIDVCGVFTAEGARLELVSCESLGFTIA